MTHNIRAVRVAAASAYALAPAGRQDNAPRSAGLPERGSQCERFVGAYTNHRISASDLPLEIWGIGSSCCTTFSVSQVCVFVCVTLISVLHSALMVCRFTELLSQRN